MDHIHCSWSHGVKLFDAWPLWKYCLQFISMDIHQAPPFCQACAQSPKEVQVTTRGSPLPRTAWQIWGTCMLNFLLHVLSRHHSSHTALSSAQARQTCLGIPRGTVQWGSRATVGSEHLPEGEQGSAEPLKAGRACSRQGGWSGGRGQ